MPNLANYVSTNRADDAWARIQDKPTSITLGRGASAVVAAQTVRVEYDSSSSETTRSGANDDGGGVSSVRGVTVFGVRGHATVLDTDIQRNDTFLLNGQVFRVVDVLVTLGEIQARAEASA